MAWFWHAPGRIVDSIAYDREWGLRLYYFKRDVIPKMQDTDAIMRGLNNREVQYTIDVDKRTCEMPECAADPNDPPPAPPPQTMGDCDPSSHSCS